MSIQAQLDQEAIDLMPIVKAAIEAAEAFEANNMLLYALRKAMNSHVGLMYMNPKQLAQFQADLIEAFKYKGWM